MTNWQKKELEKITGGKTEGVFDCVVLCRQGKYDGFLSFYQDENQAIEEAKAYWARELASTLYKFRKQYEKDNFIDVFVGQIKFDDDLEDWILIDWDYTPIWSSKDV